MAELVPVLDNHRFDEAALAGWLAANVRGFAGPVSVRQFQGGQSNPTFAMTTPSARYVMRKKPPGVLLPSAHAVEREFRVLRALRDTDVPVPIVLALCEDAAVIGTPFYVMEHVAGRVFPDLTLPDVSPADRRAMYLDAARVLGRLHAVDWRGIGLEGFGRPERYVARQVERWSRQYRESGLPDVPAMERLMVWLPPHLPEDDTATIAHGDFRIGNLMFDPGEPRVVAVLDWELATIGHPLSDLAYMCLAWRLPATTGNGLLGVDPGGIPSEAAFVDAYAAARGVGEVPDIGFYLVFSLFRHAAILAGVYKRALDGNAADARAREVGGRYVALADMAWALTETART